MKVKLWSPDVAWEKRPNGEIMIWRNDPLGPYPRKLNERLIHWAVTTPDRTWMADRQGDAWIYLQAGVCERIGGGSLDPKK